MNIMDGKLLLNDQSLAALKTVCYVFPLHWLVKIKWSPSLRMIITPNPAGSGSIGFEHSADWGK